MVLKLKIKVRVYPLGGVKCKLKIDFFTLAVVLDVIL